MILEKNTAIQNPQNSPELEAKKTRSLICKFDEQNNTLTYKQPNPLNIIIKKTPLATNINAVTFRHNQAYIIGISNTLKQHKSNFIIAHEIGHIVLHNKTLSVNMEKDHNMNNNIFSAMDIQANRFACELIMPTTIFIKKHKVFNPDQLAHYFKVNKNIIQYKIKLVGSNM